MRFLYIFSIALLLAVYPPLIQNSAFAQDIENKTVKNLDLSLYLGTWYEIASFPMLFQSQECVGTSATYTRNVDGSIKVWNQCYRHTGGTWRLDRVEGYARPTEVPGQFKVSFGGPEADYWVIILDDNYSHAVVGHPTRNYLWILSRSPQISNELYQHLLRQIEARGYNIQRLKKAQPRRLSDVD